MLYTIHYIPYTVYHVLDTIHHIMFTMLTTAAYLCPTHPPTLFSHSAVMTASARMLCTTQIVSNLPARCPTQLDPGELFEPSTPVCPEVGNEVGKGGQNFLGQTT